MLITITATISGKVQGVFFRANTQKQAKKLHLTGWVRNLANGDVELNASGEQDNITLFIEWLWQGPSRAKVNNVAWQEIPFKSFDDFQVLNDD